MPAGYIHVLIIIIMITMITIITITIFITIIGKGAQVAAGSLVLKDVPPRTMVAGSPAKEVGKVTGESSRWKSLCACWC